MFDGAYVVDGYSLVLKALFVISGYVVVLLSMNYVAEGDYWENEYYGLMLASLLGMVIMASARDLISIFVALELLSIPAYLLAAWRKRDLRSTEAGLKYFLMGVFASAIMLYGMSLLFGASGSTVLADIAASAPLDRGVDAVPSAAITVGVIFVLVGFAFKVVGVPVPHLGARHLRGSAHADRGLPVGGLQDGRVRGAGVAGVRGVLGARRHLRSGAVDPGGGLHDGGQPHGAAPEEHRAPHGLLGYRPGRVHAGSARHRRGERHCGRPGGLGDPHLPGHLRRP